VGQAGSVVIARGDQEDLALVLKAAEASGVDNAITIPLKGRAVGVLGFLMQSGLMGSPAPGGIRGQDFVLQVLQFFPMSNSLYHVSLIVEMYTSHFSEFLTLDIA